MEELWRRLRGSTPRTRACFALGGGWLVFWAGMIFTTGVPYERDILMTILPLRQFFVEQLFAGRWAQWYPYELMGVPFSGSIVASPFHPQTLLYLLFSPSVATKWALLLGSLFGLIGAYRFAREVGASRVAGVTAAYVFAFGGLAVSLASNPTFFIPLATAPWFLAAAQRIGRRERWRDVSEAAVWWALLLTGGDVQLFLECGALALVIVLVHGDVKLGRVLRFVASAGLAACLAAAELLPAIAVEKESVRAGWQGSPVLARVWAFHPLRALDFLLPHFVPITYRLDVGAFLEGQPDLFASTVFIGATAVILAGFGVFRRDRGAILWGAAGAFGFWLSLGHAGGLLESWWRLVPLFGKFRFPEKYLEILALALVPLVAWGTDRVLARPRPFLFLALAAGAALIVAGEAVPPPSLVAWANRVAGLSHGFRGELATALGNTWSKGLLLAGAELLAAGGAVFLVMNGSRASATALPAVIFAALWFGNSGRAPLGSPRVVDDPGVFAHDLQRARDPGTPPPRVIAAVGGTRERHLPDDELIRQIHLWFLSDDAGRGDVTAWSENSSAERARVMDLFSAPDSPRWWPRLNVCFRVANDAARPRFGENPLDELSGPYLALVRIDCLPRAWLASAVRRVPDERAAFQLMRGGVPPDAAVWERGPSLPEGGGTVKWLESEPGRLKLESDAITRSGLVVGDAWASGWSATVDGRAVTIYPTDVASRGIIVPAGKHLVEMKYRAPGLLAGVLLMLAGIVACLLLPVALRKREAHP